jgi:hypothetical protein
LSHVPISDWPSDIMGCVCGCLRVVLLRHVVGHFTSVRSMLIGLDKAVLGLV